MGQSSFGREKIRRSKEVEEKREIEKEKKWLRERDHFLKILVEEGYGYRYWLWKYYGTVEELVEEWLALTEPLYGIHQHFPLNGRLIPLHSWPTNKFKYHATFGRPCDTHLFVGKKAYLPIAFTKQI